MTQEVDGKRQQDEYVEVLRHVRAVNGEAELDKSIRRALHEAQPERALTLEGLLTAVTLEPIILVAPSGTGKTTELRHLARRLRALGRSAVFSDALGIVAAPTPELDEDERVAFQGLLSSQSPGVLLVDGLDELHLRQLTLEQLFRRLQREIDFSERSVRLVFSARNGAWDASATRELRRLLESVGAPFPKLVTFEPLDRQAITKLVTASGVADVEQFMTEFESQEIDDLLDLRPTDVKLLVQMYKRTGALEKWTHVLHEYVEASFVEERSVRSLARTLPLEEGQRGLGRVAAAAILMKVPHISTPTTALPESAISSRRLFADWPANKVSELFESPLFVHKGRDAEAVQLPQGRISEFLAARWLSERSRFGMTAQALREVLLVKVPWSERFEIPQAHQGLVGWLASEVLEFRRLLIHDSPALVLYGGDPDRLSDAEVRAGLHQLCDAIAERRWDGWPTPATVRRVARESAEADVKALLAKHCDAPNVLTQLMKWVESGKYGTCVDEAIRLAETSVDPLVRALAVAAVCAAAAHERHRLLPLIDDDDQYVRRALLLALVPDILSGGSLVGFIERSRGHAVRQGLGEVADRISTLDLDTALEAGLPSLSSAEVNQSTADTFEVVVPLAAARIARSGPASGTLIETLLAIERLSHDHTHMNLLDSEERALSSALRQTNEVRRELWRLRFRELALSADAYHHVDHPLFGSLIAADVDWLWGVVQEQRAINRHDARYVFERLWSGLPAEERRRVSEQPISGELRQGLEVFAKDESEREARSRAHEQAEETKHEETRRKNIAALSAKRPEIEAGADINSLEWAWQHLNSGSDSATVRPERLERYVGKEYAEVFYRGLRKCWRKMDVPIPLPGAALNGSCRLALTGVALAVRAGVDLSTLSPGEARNAARLAMHELNAFPFWFGELARVHVDQAREALRETVTAEWRYPNEDHGVLRFASYSDGEVSKLMRSITIDLLVVGPPAHEGTLHYAVDAILTSKLQASTIAALTRREVERAGSAAPGAEWLRLWAHVEPEAAADWYAKRLAAHPIATVPSFLKTAALLEQDLNERHGRTAATALMAPRPLGQWARLLLAFVKSIDDTKHEGVYSPGDRDRAQDFRYRCLSRLGSTPTLEARGILRGIRADPAFVAEQDHIDWLLAQQHAAAVEASAARWTEEDIVRLERGDEKRPRTLAELFQLVQAHLLHVHRLVADHDFSYRGIFSGQTKEREIQLWVASGLEQRARGLYSVVRENVVDDDKEVDISAFAPGIGHVPIEIKPLGKYSVLELEKTISSQLVSKYMQPPDRLCGVLLVVRRDDRKWILQGKQVGLDAVVSHLRTYAGQLGAVHGKEIHVAVIDLLAPRAKQTVPAAAALSNVKRRASKTKAKGGAQRGTRGRLAR